MARKRKRHTPKMPSLRSMGSVVVHHRGGRSGRTFSLGTPRSRIPAPKSLPSRRRLVSRDPLAGKAWGHDIRTNFGKFSRQDEW
jgi:hypothetical protein